MTTLDNLEVHSNSEGFTKIIDILDTALELFDPTLEGEFTTLDDGLNEESLKLLIEVIIIPKITSYCDKD